MPRKPRVSSPAHQEPRRPSRYQDAYERLKTAILEGRRKPGERLTEVELAQSLRVSRTTVRAVLVRLHNEGVLRLEQNRGATVRAFSTSEAIEILEVRESLEAMAAGLAASRAESEDLELLESLAAQMAEALETRDSLRYQALNREFHATIVRMSQNETLARFLAATQYPLVMGQFRSASIPHPRSSSLPEHQAVLVAIKAGDSAAAERMMRVHVSAAREALALQDGSGQDASLALRDSASSQPGHPH